MEFGLVDFDISFNFHGRPCDDTVEHDLLTNNMVYTAVAIKVIKLLRLDMAMD